MATTKALTVLRDELKIFDISHAGMTDVEADAIAATLGAVAYELATGVMYVIVENAWDEASINRVASVHLGLAADQALTDTATGITVVSA
jgi:hypothetical protein